MERKLIKDLKSLKWQNFIFLTVAGIINAIGVTMFLGPLKLFDGGLSGTSMVLWRLFPDFLGLSLFLIILNVPFFIFGFKRQGAAFTIYSLYGVGIYSLAAFVIQHVLPIDVVTDSPVVGGDILLAAVFGGLLSGVGSGMTIRFGGALDGVEVMSVIFAKFLGLTVGTFIMIYNVILFITAAILFSSWIIPLYSIIAYAIGIKAVDFTVDGIDKAKAATIITSKGNQLARKISVDMGRGITVLSAKGYYSQEDKAMLYCVVNRFQIGKLKRLVAAVDPAAFVTISEISDVMGTSVKLSKGSMRPKPKVLKRRGAELPEPERTEEITRPEPQAENEPIEELD